MEQRRPPWKMTLLTIWGGMVMSVGVYGLLVYQIAQGSGKRPTPPPGLLSLAQAISLVLPILALVAGLAFYKRLSGMPQEDGVIPAAEGRAQRPARARIMTGTIAMLALFEVVVIIGLLFFLLGGSLALFARFAVATVVLDIIGLMRVLPDIDRAQEG